MSTSDLIETYHYTATKPSLGELRARLLADESLTQDRRREFASALKSLAKVLGRPADTVHADPAELRRLTARLTPAMARMSHGRWRNVLSLTTAALAHVGLVVAQGRIQTQPSPAWTEVLALLDTTPGPRFQLSRFARYCTGRGWEPADICDGVLQSYAQDLTERSLVAEPARAARDTARFWNAMAETSEAWPQQRLSIRDNRPNFSPDWHDMPGSLTQDIERWLDWLGSDDPFDDERPFKPLRPTSVATRRRQIRAYIGALTQQGVRLHELPSLSAAVSPRLAQIALRYFWEKARKTNTVHCAQMAGLVLMIARHWAKLPEDDVKRLAEMAKKLRVTQLGMTSRNADRLRKLDDKERERSLLSLPARLAEHVEREKSPNVATARVMQSAAIVAILLSLPLRLRNLQNLRIGTHVRTVGAKRLHISFEATEVKNEVPISGHLPPEASAIVQLYIERYRPLLAIHGGDWLFPGGKPDTPKTGQSIRTQLQKTISKECGLEWSPHLFRHLCAFVILRHNPQAHGVVQRVLGHKQLSSTMSFYSGLETDAALTHYDALIAQRTQSSPVQGGKRQ